MRKLFWLLILVAVALPALAQTPEQVVKRLYTTHRKLNNLEKTVQACRDCFTPNFYNLFVQSLKTPPSGGDFLDYDFLINSQDEWGDFQVGQAVVAGDSAVVPITVWLGETSHGRDPKQTKTQGNVYLSRLHGQFCIYDIRHRGGRSVREELKGIVEANRPKKP
ncbi:MAG: DUF3828 domain-containing protein [Vulcanimicrobiota bacterium]